VPGDPNACDAEQLAAVLQKLEAEKSRAEREDAAEREALKGGQ
jgi:hypothetical protein